MHGPSAVSESISVFKLKRTIGLLGAAAVQAPLRTSNGGVHISALKRRLVGLA